MAVCQRRVLVSLDAVLLLEKVDVDGQLWLPLCAQTQTQLGTEHDNLMT